MKIGIFDSGMGGLSVLHCAKKMIPDADFIYYADEKHVPYGVKKPEEVKGFVKEIFDFMLERKVDTIVIACNTATSIVDKEYRKRFPVPIVGMEPAVKMAVDLYGAENKRILVAATPITIHGEKLHCLVEKVDTNHNVDMVALPKLVSFAEAGEFFSDNTVEYLRHELSEYRTKEIGTVVLGCTHFSYFKESFCEVIGKDIHFADGNEGTVRQLMRVLSIKPDKSKKGTIQYFISGEEADAKKREMIERCLAQLDENNER